MVWHRLVLHHFEKAIEAVSGHKDFTLPCWDATDPNQRTIPKEFLSPENGGHASLYDPDRGKQLNDQGLPDTSIPNNNINDGKTKLASSDRDDPAIKKLRDNQNSGYEVFNKTIDSTPHGGVHLDAKGKMLDFKTAGLDPILSLALHHGQAVGPIQQGRRGPCCVQLLSFDSRSPRYSDQSSNQQTIERPSKLYNSF